ncbi:hypothetical protein KFE25_002714 [Diacronema lutheri]|uniref:Uncharacterized protein n=1 Tax=Diacronema lutheri TaxID=2081491 RepID=A0A8J5XNU7_DIALT|nr:hypothetical protein KFE25_002714 [Diacronema lutheri]
MALAMWVTAGCAAHGAGPPRLELGRRPLCQRLIPALTSAFCAASSANAAADLHLRDRGSNAGSIITKDYYYENGVLPPRKLRLGQLPTDEPKFNAWGSCVENSCTYVPLQRRYEGYKKYADDVALGSAAFAQLRARITGGEWASVSAAVARGDAATNRPTGPVSNALVRAVLLGNALLISENSNDQRDALLARFYVNEAGFAAEELRAASAAADAGRALAAWELGMDSWQSYFEVVNRAIVPKVGSKFALPSP